jgi:hypothetical protein
MTVIGESKKRSPRQSEKMPYFQLASLWLSCQQALSGHN